MQKVCVPDLSPHVRPDQMQYQVYNCNNKMEVYEDRLYQCYGEFHDQELAYTLTKRIDLPKQECFVGIPSHDGKHKIMEAGEHCQRGLQPGLYGMDMEMVRDLKCGKWEAEENQNYDNEVKNEVVPELFIKLLHPKLKLKQILEAKKTQENNESHEVIKIINNYSPLEKQVFSSSSSLLSITISVTLLSVLVTLLL